MTNLTTSFGVFINEDDKFIDKVTYEMTGPPPKNHWTHKADFEEDMLKWGYTHTTLNKNTDMLIAADEDLGTLKCQKAEKFGIPIYSYEDAFKKKELLYKRVVRNKKIVSLNTKSEKYLTVDFNEEERLQQLVKDWESRVGYFDTSEEKEMSNVCSEIYKYLSVSKTDKSLYDVFNTQDFDLDSVKKLEKDLKKYQTEEYYKPILNQLEKAIIMLTAQGWYH